MKKRIPNEEISAFLDGEARDPDRIQELIDQSPDVARRHRELAGISARVQSLPGPGIRPGFARRVVTAIEERGAGRRTTWRVPVGVSFTAVAALLALMTVVGLDDSTPPATPVDAVASETDAPRVSEESLLAELEQRLSEQTQHNLPVSYSYYDEPEVSEVYAKDMLLALATPGWLEDFGAFEAMPDYRVAIDTLTESERDVFKHLLEEAARREIRGPDAQKG